jgi:predicted metal-dependent phosphotriesterase family hydrolase
MASKFTFADAKKQIKQLEQELQEAKIKAGNVILDTSDNVFTNAELKKIRILELWAVLGPIAGIIIGLILG